MEQPNRERATLQDVINYQADTYINEEDISLIQSTFKDNPRLVNTLRKVLLPSVGDNYLPIEEIGSDPWLNMDFSMMQNEEIKSIVLARQDAIKFIAGGLIRLKMIAAGAVKSPMSEELRRKKDSSK